MSERYPGEVTLTYNIHDDRYYVCDGEDDVFDVKGKSSIGQAVSEFYDIITEHYDRLTLEMALKRKARGG